MPGGITLDKFNDEELAGQWWTFFMQWCMLNNIVGNDICSAFPFKLAKGAPLLWYSSLTDTVKNNIQQLKVEFLKRFSNQSIMFDVGLFRIKQLQDETVNDFFVRLQTEMKGAVIPENIVVGIVIQALNGKIGEKVYSRVPQPLTLTEVREVALQAERAVKLNSEDHGASIANLQSMLENMSTTLMAIGTGQQQQHQHQQQQHHHQKYQQQNQQHREYDGGYNNGQSRQSRQTIREEDKICYNCATVSDIEIESIQELNDAPTNDANIHSIDTENNTEKTRIHFDLKNSDLTQEQKQKLFTFLNDNRDIFATSLSELGHSKIYKHRIETYRDAKPVKRPFYHQSPPVEKEINRHVEEMERHKLIKPSNSEYHSPVVLVKKKQSGQWRFCCDYCLLI
ncbi:unnamed protein product [Mytilus coruscus]|uniref:Retrotransposon gag domain-containing protein n=1 Tax=Mytilus coruscus TaxID=42192 RepID=A0A6J8D3F3_MYTCO|nr:unnamed protein product [Mytilus coruscus]